MVVGTGAGLTGLRTPSIGYKPFRYPWAYEFWRRQQQVHWLPEEVPLGEDVKDWASKLTDQERNLLTQIFRFFTQADVEVQNCSHEHYGRVFKPTEVKMMLAAFSNMETVHIAAYSHLLDPTMSKLAISWPLGRRFVSSVIIGVKNLHQLKENMEAADWDMPAEIWKLLEERTRPPDEYLGWFNRKNYERLFNAAEFHDERADLPCN